MKNAKKKLLLRVDEDYGHFPAYNTPSMKKSEEERNKVIPHYVMEAVKSAFQRKLSNFFADGVQEHPAAGPALPPASAQEPQPVQESANEPDAEQLTISPPEQPQNIEKLIGAAAVNIARVTKANCIITIEKGDSQAEELNLDDVKVVIFKQLRKGAYKRATYNTKMKKQQVGSVLPVKELLMEAVNKRYIGKGDKIIFVGGDTMGTWLKGFFFVLDVDKVFFDISTHHLTDKVNADVLETIISIAQEIGMEGREGRHIGTAFVVGRADELMRYTKSLLRLNPFGNLPEEARKITDIEMKETVKNLAQLDGVFLIDVSGTILMAGAYINIDQDNLDLESVQGFGTRHRCTAALTKSTDAIGIVVSASGGAVRIFKDGKVIMKLS